MQVIAHLTDQMSYATQADEPTKPKPTAKPSQNKPTASPFKPMDTPVKPTGTPVKPMDTPVKPASFPKPTTQKPAYVTSSVYGPSGFNADGGGWSLSLSTARSASLFFSFFLSSILNLFESRFIRY